MSITAEQRKQLLEMADSYDRGGHHDIAAAMRIMNNENNENNENRYFSITKVATDHETGNEIKFPDSATDEEIRQFMDGYRLGYKQAMEDNRSIDRIRCADKNNP